VQIRFENIRYENLHVLEALDKQEIWLYNFCGVGVANPPDTEFSLFITTTADWQLQKMKWVAVWRVSVTVIRSCGTLDMYSKVKQSRYRPGVAQRAPGS